QSSNEAHAALLAPSTDGEPAAGDAPDSSTTQISSQPCCASTAVAPWTWGCSSRPTPRLQPWDCSSQPLPLPWGALKEMKANLIKFLPFKYLAKELTSQAEILKKVLRDNQEHFPVVFSQASHCLELVCGVEVKEVDPREHIYIMVPNLGLTCDVMLSSGQSMPKAGLLVLILSLIMQNGDRAPEEKVWGALSRLGVCVGSVHCVFGEPRTLLTHVWVQEGYLEYRQVPYSYPARYEFLWGPRAYAETSKREVMAFLLRIKERASRAFPPLSAEAAREEDEGYLLTATPPDLEQRIAPLSPAAPAQPSLLGRGVAPLGRRPDFSRGIAPLSPCPCPGACGSSSWSPPLTSDVGSQGEHPEGGLRVARSETRGNPDSPQAGRPRAALPDIPAAGSEQEGPGGEPVDIRSPSDSPAERCCCGASLLGSQGTCSGPAAGSGDGEPRLATGEFLPPEALKEMKANLIKFLPFKYLAKELTSQAEILKKVLRDNQEHFPVVFSQASHCLELVCGVEVKEVDPREHIYIMVPNLGLTCDVMLSSGQSMPKAGLLVLILSLIMQNGDRAPEEKVWGALSRLGVCVGSVHCVFGEPRTLLTHVWVQEGYLEYRQVPYSYPARYEFLWGPRAYAETSKREVMAFLLRIKERASRAFPPLSAEAAREEDEAA
ncbi:unnamed protein product, partial [Rangifer tarandus platyrhynchus]